MDNQKLRQYGEFFSRTWNLFRKYKDIELQDEKQWNLLIAEAEDLRKKFPGNFSLSIISAVIKELDDQLSGKGMKKHE